MKQYLISFFVFCFLINIGFSAVGFMKNEIVENDSKIQINSIIVNNENLIRADLVYRISIVRASDYSIVFLKDKIFSLAAFEAKDININISNKFFIYLGEEFILNTNILSPNGAPLSGFTDQLKIKGKFNKLKITKGPFISIKLGDNYSPLNIDSFGTTGSSVNNNSNYSLNFNINLFKNISNLNYKIFIKSSYSTDNKILENLSGKFKNLNINENNFSIPMDFRIPGTYEVELHLFDDDNELFSKNVRLVISGMSASIIRIKNKQDSYKSGDVFKLNYDLIGSADGATKLDNVYLNLEIIKSGKIIKTDSKLINKLNFKVYSNSFNFLVDEDLNFYKVRLILKKGEEKFDEIELNYKPLSPKKIFSPDGRIYDPNIKGCFDNNICTYSEYEFGNCFDCDKIVNEPINPNKIIINDAETKYSFNNNSNKTILLIISIIIIGAIIIIWRIKKNE